MQAVYPGFKIPLIPRLPCRPPASWVQRSKRPGRIRAGSPRLPCPWVAAGTGPSSCRAGRPPPARGEVDAGTVVGLRPKCVLCSVGAKGPGRAKQQTGHAVMHQHAVCAGRAGRLQVAKKLCTPNLNTRKGQVGTGSSHSNVRQLQVQERGATAVYKEGHRSPLVSGHAPGGHASTSCASMLCASNSSHSCAHATASLGTIPACTSPFDDSRLPQELKQRLDACRRAGRHTTSSLRGELGSRGC